MSGRSGAGQTRGAASGPQPLKATVPYQLATGKAKPHQLSSGMRRTMSLDAIIGPYLQGHWPKEPEDSWSDKSQSRRGSGSHKRSASWGSAEHLREVSLCLCCSTCRFVTTKFAKLGTQPIPIPLAPLSTLVPRLRCSVEGLNQELEGMFICQPPHPQHRLLDVPDGHRAPVPPHSCSSGSQSDPATTPLCSSSTSSSPCSLPNYTSTSPPHSEDTDHSLPLLISSSPGPNKSCCFQREPPEGCEKVRVCEETRYFHPGCIAPHQNKPTLISSCPDPNKVNFTPHGGSAFCPVSLLKPLLPSMDLLFRSLWSGKDLLL
uniref:Family with sequence similarity 117 member Aa n=1 Tax=Anabas testudineus TaxID=64144 RepID=A0A7N6AHB4_ANATE